MYMAIIKLEIPEIKKILQAALEERAAVMNSQIQIAVEQFYTPSQLEEVVMAAALEALTESVRSEVSAYFASLTQGKTAVREIVQAWLDTNYPKGRA